VQSGIVGGRGEKSEGISELWSYSFCYFYSLEIKFFTKNINSFYPACPARGKLPYA